MFLIILVTAAVAISLLRRGRQCQWRRAASRKDKSGHNQPCSKEVVESAISHWFTISLLSFHTPNAYSNPVP
jgi:hypothetical protein